MACPTTTAVASYYLNNDGLDSSNSNDMVITGATFTTGSHLGSHALEFDGVDDYAVISADATINNLGTKSVNMWVYPDSTAGFQTLIQKTIQPGTGLDGWGVHINAGGAIYFTQEFVDTAGNAETYWLTTTAPVTTGSWQRICVTHDGTKDTKPRIWHDNVELTVGTGSPAGVGAANDDSAMDILVGLYDIGSKSGIYDGRIDMLQIFDAELTVSEVETDLWNGGTGIECPAAAPATLTGTTPDTEMSGVSAAGLAQGLHALGSDAEKAAVTDAISTSLSDSNAPDLEKAVIAEDWITA